MTQNFPTEKKWRTLARQAAQEQDPEKIVALAQQIVEAYSQEEKRKGLRPPISVQGLSPRPDDERV